MTADIVYIRLHGPGAACPGRYSIQALSGWTGAVTAWLRQGTDVYLYFDHDQAGYAAENAARLRSMLSLKGVAMPRTNAEVSRVFNRIADLLEIKGDNPFRIRAYRQAALTLENLPRPAGDMLQSGEDLSQFPGVGRDLAGKIAEIVKHGSLPMLRALEKQVPPGLSQVMQVSGLGAKRAKALHEALGIKNLQDLRAAAEHQRIQGLKGFGEKTEAKILEETRRLTKRQQRITLAQADEAAEALLEYLRGDAKLNELVIAGSYRRRKETVGDLDLLATVRTGSSIMDRFTRYDGVARVLSRGTTRSTVRLHSGLQVDLRVVAQVSYGAALLYFTGNKAHNIEIRKRGMKKRLKINEYGVFRGTRRLHSRSEAAVYEAVGLPFIPPELREMTGEVEAAARHRLPHLVELHDIRGDLHSHTTRTDGHDTLEAMAGEARRLGYDYLANSEHTQHLAMTKGLTAKDVRKQIDAVDRLNASLKGLTILKSMEVDILEDGSLDLPDEVLKELDFTVCSVHSKFNLDRDRQTARILRAMDNRCFTILGHPTARLIGKREPIDVDMQTILKAAAERGCIMEVNAYPDRLDLKDAHCRLAKQLGVKIAISTDAHSRQDLHFMRFGVDQARRGWLEPDDVVNTRPLNALRQLLKRS